MMAAGFFSLLFFISFSALIVGLIYPKAVLFFMEKQTRSMVLAIYLSATIITFGIAGALAPPVDNAEPVVEASPVEEPSQPPATQDPVAEPVKKPEPEELPAKTRKAIFFELASKERLSNEEADKKYPNNALKSIGYQRDRYEGYKKKILSRYGITPEKLESIRIEGAVSNWPTAYEAPSEPENDPSETLEEDRKKEQDAFVESLPYVRQQLKSPSTAKFSYWPGDRQVFLLGDHRFRVVSHVDSQNSFGAMIRNTFFVTLQWDGDDTWTLESIEFTQ